MPRTPRLGVDLGTTRTIVAAVDRGNYPVVSFVDGDGDTYEYVPSVAALRGDELVFGFEALAAAAEGAPIARSFKRALAFPDVGPRSTFRLGGRSFLLLDLLTGYLRALRAALSTSSLGAVEEGVPTVAAVPAHAHGAQRFLTLEAFRRAGFDVTAMINEPSAAGFEYTHRQGRTVTARRTRVLVYDLGGGTFDASLVRVDGRRHEVLGSLGLNTLGGDDFDEVLLRLVLDEAGLGAHDLDPRTLAELREEARSAKERLAPQTKRLVLDVDGSPVIVPVGDFYEGVRPLVESTIEAMGPLVGGLDASDLSEVAGIYLVGGASGLPLVPRLLRERFGRRVHRSPYPAASTAIGLAIAADEHAGYSLTDRLSRGFGVFREGGGGATLQFDPIITREEVVPDSEQVVIRRGYRAAHNVGVFRFVEYTDTGADGNPRGDLVPFAEVVFPFDPALQNDTGGTGDAGDTGAAADTGGAVLAGVEVTRRTHGPWIEEEYLVDEHGIASVRISDTDTGFSRTFALTLAGGEV